MVQALKEKFAPHIESLKRLHDEYESYLPAAFFAFGFILDVLTLGEVDDLSNMIILGVYLILSLFILILEYRGDDPKEFKSVWAERFYKYRDDVFHFLLGALLSAFTLFYFKSGSVANSFLFLVFMVSLLLLNEMELFQKKGIVIRTSLMMLCFISYLIYLVPIIIGKAGPLIFFSCLVLAVLSSIGAFYLLTKYNQKKEENLKRLLIPQVLVAIIFLLLYSFKILPPVPLSLKYIGVFHEVTKGDGEYKTKEIRRWFILGKKTSSTFKAREGDKVYLFTNIFSPGGFEGKVFIHWLYDTGNGFQTSDRIPLSITGGRQEGFRGYAYKSNYTPGDWQVRVETQNGLEIGRINFEIVIDDETDQREFLYRRH